MQLGAAGFRGHKFGRLTIREAGRSVSRLIETSVEAVGKFPKRSLWVSFDDVAMRDDDAFQIWYIGPAPELISEFVLALGEAHFFQSRGRAVRRRQSTSKYRPRHAAR